jgi:hypothetical protein
MTAHEQAELSLAPRTTGLTSALSRMGLRALLSHRDDHLPCADHGSGLRGHQAARGPPRANRWDATRARRGAGVRLLVGCDLRRPGSKPMTALSDSRSSVPPASPSKGPCRCRDPREPLDLIGVAARRAAFPGRCSEVSGVSKPALGALAVSPPSIGRPRCEALLAEPCIAAVAGTCPAEVRLDPCPC